MGSGGVVPAASVSVGSSTAVVSVDSGRSLLSLSLSPLVIQSTAPAPIADRDDGTDDRRQA